MSRIILPPGFILPTYHLPPPPIILPPGNLWMYTIYPHPVSFCPLKNCFMIYTIYICPVSFCPLDSFCPHIILPPGNGLMIYTIYACPVSFCHCIRLLFHTNKKALYNKSLWQARIRWLWHLWSVCCYNFPVWLNSVADPGFQKGAQFSFQCTWAKGSSALLWSIHCPSSVCR